MQTAEKRKRRGKGDVGQLLDSILGGKRSEAKEILDEIMSRKIEDYMEKKVAKRKSAKS